ncbi:hypothetical protein WDH52_20380 [Streptomyces sp. TRM70308]|uniref:hypothetical protein n=1 Tax=Streptomyces sp. TRM70308 TaxID=3131932 RepID=UPI003D059DC3
MTKLRRLPVLLLPLALVACGTESPATAPDSAELERRAEIMQTDLAHVYLTEADGYELAEQSVGVYGDDGFSAHYASAGAGAMFQLTVVRGELTCERPGIEGGTGTVTCEEDGDLLYRTAQGAHEYARAEEGRVVRVSAASATDRETLRSAAESAHQATPTELDALLPPLTDAPAPVERGDLPPGDGAPQDPPMVGG